MPELPEVETQRRDLIEAGLVGSVIEDVRVLWPKSLQGEISPDKLVGRYIITLKRRGKLLCFHFSGGLFLLAHLRMSGGFRVDRRSSPADSHDRFILHTDKIKLVFHDTRKFGRLYLTSDPEALTGRLGPEPLDADFTAEVLFTLLRSRNRMIKPLLLDQHQIAGLGNIYVDEALFRAGIHPTVRSSTLSSKQAEELHTAITSVLTEGIANRGTSLGKGEGNFSSGRRAGTNRDNLRVFGRAGKPCPVCGRVIERIVVSQRATHICRFCQKNS